MLSKIRRLENKLQKSLEALLEVNGKDVFTQRGQRWSKGEREVESSYNKKCLLRPWDRSSMVWSQMPGGRDERCQAGVYLSPPEGNRMIWRCGFLDGNQRVIWRSCCISRRRHKTLKMFNFAGQLEQEWSPSSCLNLHHVNNFRSLVK